MSGLLKYIGQISQNLDKKSFAQIFRFKSFVHGDVFGPHYHKRIEINYVKKGSCSMLFGDDKVDFDSSDLMVVFPDIEHSFIPHKNGVELVQLEFMPDLFWSIVEKETCDLVFIQNLFTSGKKYVKIVNSIDIAQSVQRVVDELIEEKESYDLLVMMYYAELVLLISRHMKSTFNTGNAHLDKALSIMHASYNNNISQEEIAEQCGISQRYLRKLFSSHLSMSVTDYLNRVRINKAKELLRHTNYSIKEISFLTGFNSVEYFVRVFKNNVGMSAKSYKKSIDE